MRYIVLLLTFLLCRTLGFASSPGHLLNFPSIPAHELVKMISKIAEVNFIVDEELLHFNVCYISGKSASKEELVGALILILNREGLDVTKEHGYYFIQKKSDDPVIPVCDKKSSVQGRFHKYKLQYHLGSEIQDALKQISSDCSDEALASTIRSLQWIRSTNSLLFSGTEESIDKVSELIKSLDTPLKQVFIEVLVIETNINNSLDFGLKWSATSKYRNRTALPSFSENALGEIPPVSNFSLGIIGDIICHKGKSFLSLGALITALQQEGKTSIVLNQKIITQENKLSHIFVGDNVPFAGAVVQTTGSSQQTTANIEYRDVGVSLSITPLLGESDIITLEIAEEITEAIDQIVHKGNQLSGIKTSKTNMATSVHVPDGHFLILSGMTKNVHADTTSGPPCLGGIPFLGNLFNKKDKKIERSNLLIFVKPHIITSTDEYVQFSSRFER